MTSLKNLVKQQLHAGSASSSSKLLGSPSAFSYPIMPKKLQSQPAWLASARLHAPAARTAGAAVAALLLLFYGGSLLLRPATVKQCSHTARHAAAAAGGRPSPHGPTSGMLKSADSVWRRPVVLLLGDSITELGEDDDGGWGSRLGKAYRRKADVLNRGFAGYNTLATLYSLPEILDGLCRQQIILALLWLGANDAAIPGARDGAAHVPLDSYASNLQSLVQMMQSAGVQQLVLATPPPVWEDAPKAKAPDQAYPRTFNVTAKYAEAARAAAAKLSLPLLDVFTLFTGSQGWQQSLLLPDGLHLSKQGQAAVYDGLLQLIEQQLPQLKPAALPWHHPSWRGLYAGNLATKFAAEQAAYQSEFGEGQCCGQCN